VGDEGCVTKWVELWRVAKHLKGKPALTFNQFKCCLYYFYLGRSFEDVTRHIGKKNRQSVNNVVRIACLRIRRFKEIKKAPDFGGGC